MAIHNYQGLKFIDGKTIKVDDNLVIEQALQISINKKTFTITMRTPGNDEDLVRGLLYSEDIYRNNKTLHTSISENEKKNITEANVEIDENLIGDGYLNSRNILSVSSCGICGKTKLEEIDCSHKIVDHNKISIIELFNLFVIMKKHQPTFHQSGGSHAAAAFSGNLDLLSIREDIGRHNAVDKVVGDLITQQRLNNAKILTVSGRISYEIIAKAFAAKIPILAAVSAPSTLAVDFSKELGITLLAFCRENKATCYSHPERLISPST